jgi:hypothetical protein
MPVEIAITSGIASPSACGHEMTRTVTVRSTASPVSPIAVGESLGARVRGLCLLDEAPDAGESGVFAHGLDADPQGAVGRDGAGDHAVTGAAVRGAGLAGDHRLVHRGVALDDRAVGRDPPAGSDEHEVSRLEIGDGHAVRHRAVEHLGLVGEERGEGFERARGLPEGPHLLPVTEQHHVDQERELPPELEVEPAELRNEARNERHHDRERDQEHHPGPACLQLGESALEEGQAPVEEDDRAEDRRDPIRHRERRGRIAEPVLDHLGPEQDWDREDDAQPEAVAEHRDAVAGVSVVIGHLVPRVGVVAGHIVSGVAVLRVFGVQGGLRVMVVPRGLVLHGSSVLRHLLQPTGIPGRSSAPQRGR